MAPVASTDHPLHPATVHWPLAFLTASYALDALYPIYGSLPSTITHYLPPATELSRISYYSLGAGLLFSLPSAATGVAQAAKIIKSQGMYNPDGSMKAKVKTTIAHAAINDIVIAASAYSWWCRRQAGSVEMLKEGLNPVAYEPQGWMVGMSVVLGVAILFAANLGGTLVYHYGMGFVQRGKKTE